jgi:Mitochondrial carrier protein
MTVESTSRPTGAVLLAPSPAGGQVYDLMYYLKGAAAGGICCSITHGALTPVDVVKTRVQLDSAKVRPLLLAALSNGKTFNLSDA